MASIVHIHAGRPRTGTTSIQTFLSENPELLAANGYSYPTSLPGFAPAKANNGIGLATQLRSGRPDQSALGDLALYLSMIPNQSTIISGEQLFGIPESAWALLRHSLNSVGLQSRVHVYIREPVTGGAHDADDRIIYNTSTGNLFYDADGNGAGAATRIATLNPSPDIPATILSQADFLVI